MTPAERGAGARTKPMRHMWRRVAEGKVVCLRRGCNARKWKKTTRNGRGWLERLASNDSCRPKAVVRRLP